MALRVRRDRSRISASSEGEKREECFGPSSTFLGRYAVRFG